MNMLEHALYIERNRYIDAQAVCLQMCHATIKLAAARLSCWRRLDGAEERSSSSREKNAFNFGTRCTCRHYSVVHRQCFAYSVVYIFILRECQQTDVGILYIPKDTGIACAFASTRRAAAIELIAFSDADRPYSRDKLLPIKTAANRQANT